MRRAVSYWYSILHSSCRLCCKDGSLFLARGLGKFVQQTGGGRQVRWSVEITQAATQMKLKVFKRKFEVWEVCPLCVTKWERERRKSAIRDVMLERLELSELPYPHSFYGAAAIRTSAAKRWDSGFQGQLWYLVGFVHDLYLGLDFMKSLNFKGHNGGRGHFANAYLVALPT